MAEYPSETRIRRHFLGWQCRVRQHAIRQHGGRPPPGAIPRVMGGDGGEISPAMTVLLVETAPADSTAAFRHIVSRTHDPSRRYEDALKLLSSAHYQRPENFSDVLTALFGDGSPLAGALLTAAGCVLEFDQFGQSYRIPCTVTALTPDSAVFQATYWHNRMFNAAMPGGVQVLAFTPDWRRATAAPAV